MLTIARYDRLSMALELAKHNPVYEDIASKFFEVSGALCYLVIKTWIGLTKPFTFSTSSSSPTP